MPEPIKIFISYARRDSAFAARLADALSAASGITVFKDTADILPTEEWRARLEDLIARADAIVFCLSEASAASAVCAWEVETAAALNKRILPLLIEAVPGAVPEGLAKLNYIDARAPERFATARDELISALQSDIAWIREHSRLGEAARRWQRAGRNTSALLRGDELQAALAWARARPLNAPLPSAGTTDWLDRSLEAERRAARDTRRNQALLITLLLSIIAGLIGFINQDRLREIYHWHVIMGATVLPPSAERTLAEKPGATFSECRTGCPKMVVIPAGTFEMGSPDGVGENDEQPKHTVTIERPFAVSETEITFDQWDACVAAGACQSQTDNGWGRGRRPAIYVTGMDAKRYAAWLSKLTGHDYRLLSESEWEYAARAGRASQWPMGLSDADIADEAWFMPNADGKTEPVGMKKPNAFGLYDMHGNVSEWTADCANQSYAAKPEALKANGAAWMTGECDFQVYRGGFYSSLVYDLRAAWRSYYYTDYRENHLGMRLARTLAP